MFPLLHPFSPLGTTSFWFCSLNVLIMVKDSTNHWHHRSSYVSTLPASQTALWPQDPSTLFTPSYLLCCSWSHLLLLHIIKPHQTMTQSAICYCEAFSSSGTCLTLQSLMFLQRPSWVSVFMLYLCLSFYHHLRCFCIYSVSFVGHICKFQCFCTSGCAGWVFVAPGAFLWSRWAGATLQLPRAGLCSGFSCRRAGL